MGQLAYSHFKSQNFIAYTPINILRIFSGAARNRNSSGRNGFVPAIDRYPDRKRPDILTDRQYTARTLQAMALNKNEYILLPIAAVLTVRNHIRNRQSGKQTFLGHYSSSPLFFQSISRMNDIEDIILSHSLRGIDTVKHALPEGYCRRAAEMIIANPGTVLIGTGFPVGDSFETDGPIGAIGLYRVLEQLDYHPLFVCAPPISRILTLTFATYEIPILDWEASFSVAESTLGETGPSVIVSVERPGVSRDGRYYNMRRQDITDRVAKFDIFFRLSTCPTLAFGDGGNEIGMGNLIEALAHLPIIPSVTTCDELVISTVSNWGVYGVIAAMSRILHRDLFNLFDAESILDYLVANGSVDGLTTRSGYSEDGFPITVGLSIIDRLRNGFTP